MIGEAKRGMFARSCIVTAMLGAGCKPCPKNDASTSPTSASRPSGSAVVEPPHDSPASAPSKYYLSDAIAVAESAIAGDHIFEWAQAVAFARSIDPTGDQLADGLGTLIATGSPAEVHLAARFLRDVRAKDGPQWKEPMPVGLLGDAVNLASSSHPKERTVRYRVMALAEPDEAVRIDALLWLAKTGGQIERHVPRIAPHLQAKGVEERLATIQVLDVIVRRSPEAADVLATALKDPDPQVRSSAARAISSAPSISSKTADLLVAAMSDRDINVRRSVSAALVRFVDTHPQAATAMVNALRDSDPIVRQDAIDSFSRPDVLSAASTAALITALRHPDPRVRRDAAYALQARKADTEDVLAALTVAVDHGNFIVREGLADAMERAQREKSTALAVLKMTAEHGSSPTVQAYARAALREVEGKKDDSR